MRSWGMTDTGLVRRENQDSYDVRTLLGYTSENGKAFRAMAKQG